MDFESPDVAKDFPGLYASENASQSRDSYDSEDEKSLKKDLLGKKKDKKESKKDKGYVVFEEESSEDEVDNTKSPSKNKKVKSSSFKFPGKDKKEKSNKVKEKDVKEKKEEKEKNCKKDAKEEKKENKDVKKDTKENKKQSKEGRKESKEHIKDNCETKKECKDAEKVNKKKKKESKLLRLKDKRKKSDVEPQEEKFLFGVPLQVAVERSKIYDGIEIPVVVRECIDYIEEHGLACEGIYRTSSVKSKLRHLKNLYNKGEKVDLYEHEPHLVASLLKQYLRDLPEPILTTALAAKFEEAAGLKDETQVVESIEKLLSALPSCNYILLSWIFTHMKHIVQMEKRNKMNLQNVLIVLSPTLQISHNVLHALFAHSDFYFNGVELKRYAPHINLDASNLSLELLDSPTTIANELSKQENVLNILHAELNTGLRDQQKEEQLWEIQRIVTQLKRKLRFLQPVKDDINSTTTGTKETVKDDGTDQTPIDQTPIAEPQDISSTNSVQQLDCETNKTDELKEDVITTTGINIKRSESLCLQESHIIEEIQASQKQLKLKENLSTSDEEKIVPDTIESNPKDDDDCRSVTDEVQQLEENTSDISLRNDGKESPISEKSSQQEIDDGTSFDALVHEAKVLQLRNEELELLKDELKRKIKSERKEVERLKTEIKDNCATNKYRQYSLDSNESPSSDSEDSSGSSDDGELSAFLGNLIQENIHLESKNKDLSTFIQQERELCLNIKVHMKLIQNDIKNLK